MKRCAVCILLLFLTGCSENDKLNAGMELRSRLLQSSQCSFSITADADYGSQIYSFSMDCTADPQGNIDFTVTEPESIAGISGKLSSESGTLTFEKTALHFPLMADELLSPVSAPWILLKTLLGGCLTACTMEEDLLRVTVDDSYADDALHLDIWLDGGDVPVRGEILWQGRRILSLEVKNFQIL